MDITIKNTSKEFVSKFCKKHHFYMDYAQPNGSVEHKILLNDNEVGILQYGYMCCSSKIAGIKPGNTMQVSRMAFKIHKPNLPTASLSKSIGKAKQDYMREKGVKLLVAYSRVDFEGTVYKAYGFDFDGISEGSKINKLGHIPTVGNRPAREIYSEDKKRWVFHL